MSAPTKRFTIARDGGKYAKAIRYGGRWVLHLREGTELNERNVRWIVDVLNGKPQRPDSSKPQKPFYTGDRSRSCLTCAYSDLGVCLRHNRAILNMDVKRCRDWMVIEEEKL